MSPENKPGLGPEDVVSSDFGDESSNQWLVERFIPKGEIGTIFADPGTGKTMLLMDMVAAGMTGHDTMRQLDTESMDSIVWFNQDMGRGEWENRFKRIFNAKYDGEGSGRIYPKHFDGIYLDTSDGADRFQATLAKRKPDLVVIDSLAQHMDGDPSSLEDVRDMLRAVREATEEYPATVIFCAHTNKRGGFYGSQANKADTDFTWMAEPKPSKREDTPHQVVVRNDKSRNANPMTGFQYRINPNPLECVWVRPIRDNFTIKERLDALAALDFAHKVEEDADGDAIKVSDFVKEMRDQMGRTRARRAFDELARENGLLALSLERGRGGAHIYEVTPKGRRWYDEEMEYAQESIQQTLQVDVDESIDEATVADVVESGEATDPDPDPESNLHVEDRWIEVNECGFCGAPGHKKRSCPALRQAEEAEKDDGLDLDDVMDDPIP